jgi:hypothetical protein
MGRCVVPPLAAVVLLLTGCGGGSYDQSTSTTATPTSTTATPTSSTADAAGTTPPASGAGGTTSAVAGTFTGEDLTADQAAQLQQDVDAGHQPWRLDQVAVAEAFVADRLGWTDVDGRTADPHTVEVTNRMGGAAVVLQLTQPVREGPDGIWVVVSGTEVG